MILEDNISVLTFSLTSFSYFVHRLKILVSNRSSQLFY
ncbi:unnamed protein product [Nezara viridula]|uniref:Uncharacterized protein n=1 Tax=Nezara viridula TaxID=85310 RepID=A0A9P0EBV7_NEZVI|nr:unnamed protein product [Nezara viridula]